MTRRRGKGQKGGVTTTNTDVVAEKALLQPSHSTNKPSSQTSIPTSSPTSSIPPAKKELPIEVLEQIFSHLNDRLNPNPSRWWETVYINNKTFVRLSLVCKDWHELAKPFRSSLYIASEKGARRFISTFRRAKLHVSKLHYDSGLPEDLLAEVLPLIPKKSLKALSVPVDMIQGKHVYHILKNEATLHPIESLHIHGRLADDYHTSWWKKAYIMHNVPTLTELSLTGLYIKGLVREVSAAVKSPIKKLQLERLRFHSGFAVEHLCRPILYELEDIRFQNIPALEVGEMINYLCTSWTGIHRIEVKDIPDWTPFGPEPLIVDTRTGELPEECISATSKDARLQKIRAMLTLGRQLRFETSKQMGFLFTLVDFCKDECKNPYHIPRSFQFRRKLDEDQLKAFNQAYALLTGSHVKPKIIDPSEFFDIYGGNYDDDSGNWDGPNAYE